MDRPRPENEPLLVLNFFINSENICQKTELKSCWTVPVKISYSITWLAIVQLGHESASGSANALRFFSGSASAFFRCGSATLPMRRTYLFKVEDKSCSDRNQSNRRWKGCKCFAWEATRHHCGSGRVRTFFFAARSEFRSEPHLVCALAKHIYIYL